MNLFLISVSKTYTNLLTSKSVCSLGQNELGISLYLKIFSDACNRLTLTRRVKNTSSIPIVLILMFSAIATFENS